MINTIKQKILSSITITTIILSTFLFSNFTQAQECPSRESIRIGDLNWDSANFHTAIAKTILEKGYGCEVEVTTGDTVPILVALSKNDVNINIELWKDLLGDSWTRFRDQGVVEEVGTIIPNAYDGWFVPRYLVEGDSTRGIEPTTPELKTVFDLKRYKEVFKDREDPTKGRFINCPIGWGCEDISSKKLIGYGLDEDFTNFRVGTGAALDAEIARSFKLGLPIVFYYWAPTWVLSEYDLIKLEEPAYNKEVFEAMRSSRNPTSATETPPQNIGIAVNTEWANAQGNDEIIDFLRKYTMKLEDVNEALNYMKQNKVNATEAANNFLKTNSSWHQWVDEGIRDAVLAGL